MARIRKVRVTVQTDVSVQVNINVKPDRSTLLRFGKGNNKLSENVATFSLPAGHACLGAKDCLASVNPDTGLLTDGPNTEFRCFAATMECRHTSVRRSRWHNLNLIRAARSQAALERLILASLPTSEYVRVHVSGDFVSQRYFDAWMNVARQCPRTIFYAYTKSLPFWVQRLGAIPSNVRLTASFGGKWDNLIHKHSLRWARVVFSQSEADTLNVPVDHNDSHAMADSGNFAILLHGQQPKGSAAQTAQQALKSEGWEGYGKGSRVALPMVGG